MPEKRAAVVIGVNHAGTLPALAAAVSGAKNFADWAGTQGFEVELITDQSGIVTLQVIRNAIKHFVDAQQYVQLVIYFAGHGILRGPDYELWLLSEAPGDPNEAVAVPTSIVHSRNCGIRHIVWISDACRSVPDTPLLNGITGSIIFPNKPPQASRPAVDLFYATLPGDPAYEVKANEAVKNYRGIFTDCLLDGLRTRPTAVMSQRDAPPPPWVIPSWKMKLYLEEHVPIQAAAVRIDLVQSPDIRVESHDPACLAECPDYTPPPPKHRDPGGPPHPPSPPTISPTISVYGPNISGDAQNNSPEIYPDEPNFLFYLLDLMEYFPRVAPALKNAAKENASVWPIKDHFNDRTVEAITTLLRATGRASFETRTGFTIIGSGLNDVALNNVQTEKFCEDDAWHLRVHLERPQRYGRSLLLQFGEGNGTVVSPLYGFIGTVVVTNGRVVNVSYLPSMGTKNYGYYMENKDRIDLRHAYIAGTASQGAFRIDPAKAINIAKYLRMLKSIDPTLGLYAAYAYIQAGDFEGVNSVFRYMKAAPEPIPFDVALLAGKVPEHYGLQKLRIGPCCPMLTQGWAFLDSAKLPKALQEAQKHLIPSLWTTFSETGVGIIKRAMKRGDLV